MLECLSFKSFTPSITNLPHHPPPLSASHSQENSTEQNTPATSTRSSPTPNVSREYDLAVQAHSYNEIRSMVQAPPQVQHFEENENDEDSHHRHVLSQVLQPDAQSVREALANAKPNSTLTRLVSTYFDHSETTSDLCLLLCRSVHRARLIYSPLSDLLSVLPAAAADLSQSHCDRVYDIFLQFDSEENPFIFPHSHSFTGLRRSFSELKLSIDLNRQKCQSRIRYLSHATSGCAVCVVITVLGAVVSAAVVATHAVVGFAAVAAVPFCNASCIPRPKQSERKEVARLKQLDAAANAIFVVNDLDTIDSLIDRLQTQFEGDKAQVRFALERGRDRHPIQEVLKQLRKSQPVFEQLLNDLEQHIYLCFYAVNKARYALLKEISLHQTL